uniref:Ribosomal protein S1 n=1 Tax=Gelidium sinicola TaxID=1911539 RepID=A0A411FSY1_9FLOR|nr:ribosomal protein S1 [Gelidium sinicola]QBA96675.1 ribosomal protein S1 [Gelidium sinicola]
MIKKHKFTEKRFISMLNKYNYDLHLGDIVAGTIFNLESQGYLIDIGTHIAGYLPYDETLLYNRPSFKFTSLDNQITRDFFILAYQKHSQQILLSIKRLDYIRAWKRVKQLHIEDVILNAPVINTNKGGIITYIEGLQGFIPKSHLIHTPEFYSNQKTIKCQLLIIDEKSNKLILSNKRAMLSLTKDKFKIDLIVEGKIIAIKTYGVFIEINNIIALLHISEIGYKYIDNLDNLFTIGNYTKVKIIHIDMKQGRLSVTKRGLN